MQTFSTFSQSGKDLLTRWNFQVKHICLRMTRHCFHNRSSHCALCTGPWRTCDCGSLEGRRSKWEGPLLGQGSEGTSSSKFMNCLQCRAICENLVTNAAAIVFFQCRRFSLFSRLLNRSRLSTPKWTFKPNPRKWSARFRSTLNLRMQSKCQRMAISPLTFLALPLLVEKSLFIYLICWFVAFG